MFDLKEIDAKLGEKIRKAMHDRHWSSRVLSNEIKKAGGHVAYATIDNIAQNPTKAEFLKLYWVLRLLNITLGSAFDFTVQDGDERAHRMLANVFLLGPEDRAIVMDFLQYVLSKSSAKENIPKRA